ncbi:branched-chain amino acid ABC transporter substrate-binding protein [Kineococcus rhizosphaerae]|uniref:Amino acid/amide ABC transporter substrate-binding protein (HAAT family) n=1 Tax=Kineococcus rhizosphaerae TaxID=559628 RepID=A0A2T0RA18_9ACTN|nr:branched-chain amino acid ABC transporter substrate-binding protein [Kineococcus rhizosphaerae]PRY17980.1 amino acid/amide ABC transporter substrate-binding protein (HAAT family) [Kineococcus rhizosphaerae]
MRSLVKLAAPAAAAALLLAACGTTGGDDTSSGAASSGGSSSCPDGISIGFFGALTGPNANLGVNEQNGVKLAIDQHNAESGACQVKLTPYDSQGDQNQAQGLAQQVVGDEKVVGIVGPAFSGESKVADPIFNEAGIVGISPSATNPALADNGWKTFFRVLGNDASQGPAAAKYITDTLGKQKVYVIDDATEYGKGLSDIVRKNLGAKKVKDNTVQTGQTDFSAVVADVQASGADSVFFGGYYPEGGLLLKQLREAGLSADKLAFVTDDGAKDEGLVTAAGAENAEGALMTCPCLPPDKAGGTFVADYTKAYGTAPATYSAEAFDAATILLNGIAEGKVSREDLLSYVKSYDKPGVTKQLKFDDKGEPSEVSVWAYKVQGGQIVADQEINAS